MKQCLNENKVGEFTLPDFKTYYKVIKTACYWHKDSYTEVSEIELGIQKQTHIYGQLIFNKCGKISQWFSINDVETRYPHAKKKKMKLDFCLIP
jgi:hypothetical protein